MADKWIQLMSEDGTDNLFPTSKMDLLWTNASPNSGFSAQTVALDLGDYRWVYIVIKPYYENNEVYNTLTYNLCSVPGLCPCEGTYDKTQVSRTGIVSSTGINFNSSGKWHQAGQDGTSDNFCIPYQIYGIK